VPSVALQLVDARGQPVGETELQLVPDPLLSGALVTDAEGRFEVPRWASELRVPVGARVMGDVPSGLKVMRRRVKKLAELLEEPPMPEPAIID
jgi:hypothetical protein